MIGFLLLASGIGAGFYLSAAQKGTLEMSYVASGAGILTELISGVFFALYQKTLQQINRFHDRLATTQQISMLLLASSLVAEPIKRDDAKIALAKTMMSLSTAGCIPEQTLPHNGHSA